VRVEARKTCFTAPPPAAAFDNAGQDCCGRSGLPVQRSVYAEFLALLEPHVLGWKRGTGMGSLISAPRREHVASYVDDPLIQGETPTGKGFWLSAIVPAVSPTTRPSGCPAPSPLAFADTDNVFLSSEA
jgi:acyl-CoA reductase-like NAD-dependent aldehyde dehydrogenase